MPTFRYILVFVIIHRHTLKFVISYFFSLFFDLCQRAGSFAELYSNTMFVGSTTTVCYFFHFIRPIKLNCGHFSTDCLCIITVAVATSKRLSSVLGVLHLK